MTTFERLNEHGQVVERVVAVTGSHEDTRLGVAVLEGRGGWRIVEPAPPTQPSLPSPEPERTPAGNAGTSTAAGGEQPGKRPGEGAAGRQRKRG